MSTTYDVRIWKIETYQGKTKKTYKVRWQVGKQRFKRSYSTTALAESFRSELITAARRGEAFDCGQGLPISMLRTEATMSWYDFACAYVEMKWPDASPGHRRTIADALVPITVAMLTSRQGMPQPKTLRHALRQAFSLNARKTGYDGTVDDALRWVARNTRPVGDLAEPEVLRDVLSHVEKKLDGKQAAADTMRLRRTTLRNALDYAVEKKLLTSNPIYEVRAKKRRAAIQQVDRRSVANPTQARALLDAVAKTGKSGPRLVAFFALMYYAALRPEEATTIRKRDLSLPAEGWGEIYLVKATPEIGKEWTDSGSASEERGLKHRDDGTGRTVPCPPRLTELLHEHLDAYGTAHDGRLFRGARHGGRVGSTTYGRVWAKARAAALPADAVTTPLAKRPYDLRHAAVSTWLNAGVEAPRVAQWAGHSLSVLLRVYAKCLDGGEQAARDRVENALRDC